MAGFSKRPAATEVVELILGDVSLACKAIHRLDEQCLWPAAFQLVQLWRVVPQFARRLEALGWSLEPEFQKQLESLSQQSAMKSRQAAQRAVEVMAALANTDILVPAFKGIAVMALLLEDPAQRMVYDIDLLARESDVDVCFEVFGKLGFLPSPAIPRTEFAAYLASVPFEAHGAYLFEDSSRLAIDLHWRMGRSAGHPLQVERLLQRCRSATLLGQSVQVVDPVDGMLLTVEHALRDRFAPWPVVKDLCDLAWWIQRQPPLRDPGRWMERAKAAHLIVPALALFRLLGQLDPGSPAGGLARMLEEECASRQRRWAGRLQDLFWLQVHEGPVPRDVVGLLSFGSLGRFLMGRLPWASRTRKVRQLVQTPAQKQMSWATRLMRLLSQLRHFSPRRLLLLRTVIRQRRRYQTAVLPDS